MPRLAPLLRIRALAAAALALAASSLPAAPGATLGRARATVYYDVEYGRAGDAPLLLDAGLPPGPGPHPLAIIVHGGGWSGGDKALDITGLFQPLNEAGFVWLSINYRLAPAHRWPAAFEDLRAAIRWAKGNAARLSADPGRVALIGYSAGGQLAALAACLADEDTAVQAVVGIAPALDLVTDMRRRGRVSPSLRDLLDLPEQLSPETEQRIAAISPSAHLRPGLPPFLLLQGDADKTVLAEHTLAFAERLRALGGECDLVTIVNAPHRLADWDKYAPDYKTRTSEWLLHRLDPISAP